MKPFPVNSPRLLVPILLVGVLSAAWAPRARAIAEGDPAPVLQLDDIVSGDTFSLEQFRGRVVCINFWAYW